jgi:hypothetical protein
LKQPKQLFRIKKNGWPRGETNDTDTSSRRTASSNAILTDAAEIGTGESRNWDSSSFMQISAVCIGCMAAPGQNTSRETTAGYVPKLVPVILMALKIRDAVLRADGTV